MILGEDLGEAIPCLHIPPLIIELFALRRGKGGRWLTSQLTHSHQVAEQQKNQECCSSSELRDSPGHS